jgi:hydroxymethylpyrimidine pyrophosphatase-like HAD family hydrolase
MIIAIDFDGTICRDAWPDIGEPIPGALEAIRVMREHGHTLILWTCREGAALDAAIAWLEDHGVWGCFEGANVNAREMVKRYGNDCRKIGADMYIDDRGYNRGWEDIMPYVRMWWQRLAK